MSYNLVLFTTRNSKQALEWLQSNKIDKYFKDVTNVKKPAFIYIDDRALKFNGDYNTMLKKLKTSMYIGINSCWYGNIDLLT